MAFHCYVLYILIPNINSGAFPILYFVLYGSADPTVGNKDKFGRLRSVHQFVMLSVWAVGQAKKLNLCKTSGQRKDKNRKVSLGDDSYVAVANGHICPRRWPVPARGLG